MSDQCASRWVRSVWSSHLVVSADGFALLVKTGEGDAPRRKSRVAVEVDQGTRRVRPGPDVPPSGAVEVVLIRPHEIDDLLKPGLQVRERCNPVHVGADARLEAGLDALRGDPLGALDRLLTRNVDC